MHRYTTAIAPQYNDINLLRRNRLLNRQGVCGSLGPPLRRGGPPTTREAAASRPHPEPGIRRRAFALAVPAWFPSPYGPRSAVLNGPAGTRREGGLATTTPMRTPQMPNCNRNHPATTFLLDLLRKCLLVGIMCLSTSTPTCTEHSRCAWPAARGTQQHVAFQAAARPKSKAAVQWPLHYDADEWQRRRAAKRPRSETV